MRADLAICDEEHIWSNCVVIGFSKPVIGFSCCFDRKGISEEPRQNYLEMHSIWIEAKAEGKPVSGCEIVRKVLKKKVAMQETRS
ncbi:unnamed protein product [Linum trigynum]|uniref:Uncharacterized protein n=1 Tax=Linum trigynum TaxID=586398 RepID=A0AAV2DD97_9ROSI